MSSLEPSLLRRMDAWWRADDSRPVYALGTDEEAIIARAADRLLG